MGQPVKLSDDLMLDARVTSEITERSIAGQIEYWARIGRAAELSLRGDQALRLKQRGEVRPLSECIKDVDGAASRARLAAHLDGRPFPHFEAAPGRPGALIKIDEDGTRTVGRFVNREFRVLPPK